MIYLGTPGRMVGISCPAEQRLNTAERYSFQTTLEGRVRAQVRPGGRRVWDLRLPRTSSPSEVATLAEFANGAWGPGPFWFVSADAPVVNLLTPGAAESDATHIREGAGIQGGPWETPWGFAARSIIQPGATFIYWDTEVPVLPGVPVTGSAVVDGSSGGYLRLWWRSPDGGVDTTNGDRIDGSGPQRASVTATPPEGATHVRLGLSQSITRAAFPAVTWTDQPFEWGDGQGCEKAVVLGGQRDLVQALDTPVNGRYSDYSFTVQEVG